MLISAASFGQKKVLDHADFDIWNTIQNQTISANGDFIMYSLEKGEGDSFLKIKDPKAILVFEHERSVNGKFTYDSKFAIFNIKAWQDTVREMKRRKVKKDDLPKDTLAIYNLENKSITKIAQVRSYKLPEKWSGHIAYQLEEIKPEKKEEDKKDETEEEEKPEEEVKEKIKPAKKVSKDNGYHLLVRNLETNAQDTFKYVTNYIFAKEGKRLAYITTGVDSTIAAGVYVLNLENNQLTNVFTAEKAKYPQLSLSESGKNLGFVADLDTTKIQIRPNELYLWKEGEEGHDLATKLADASSSPQGYRVSADGAISFSKDETRMFFGLATLPIVKDTTLLEEEIVNVEVWTYNEPRLYTVQELQVEADQKRSYTTVIRLNKNNQMVQLATTAYPDSELGDEGNAEYALVSTSRPYELESQWEGGTARDFAVVNTNTGEAIKALSRLRGRVSLSPAGKYLFGYDMVDSSWFTYAIATARFATLTKGEVFYNELNDSPTYPYPYGAAGWTENDASIVLYDRFDMWELNPDGTDRKRLTTGRENEISYRYIKLDKEERFLPNQKWLLQLFDDKNKHAGYFEFNKKNGKGKQLLLGPYRFSNPIKSELANDIIFTRQSFQEFPDIRYTDLTFKTQTKISDANPQQDEYNWGTAELVSWISLDGVELRGMLIKPENFDPNKKYPMIVNFYEKSSNGLYRHYAPSPGRSTINYSFYASRGYLIFNPDVNYRIGYAGESAFNCVIPGVNALIDKGFVDKENIGVQGHSWGGYQIAYLVTKTDMFKAAEAGAPVPNMISAYGGIRWWTGLSRQFQYEHTQSRIGGTPWEYPLRYIENSPIFFIDKINTPLLIMHNDADGHVPWYQGIEFFVSLRRLGKPSWFLNYNGEPHWPLKLQNRKDFNIRMAQFFDHYLKAAPLPVWMERGVPAIEKGINQGLELIDQ